MAAGDCRSLPLHALNVQPFVILLPQALVRIQQDDAAMRGLIPIQRLHGFQCLLDVVDESREYTVQVQGQDAGNVKRALN